MDYGHDLLFGTFVTPSSQSPASVVDLAMLADRVGLDLVTFQDHPYQPALLDAWTLMSFVASKTTRIHLSGNVLNLPLRQPAVLARSAASLDRLSGGRVELGLGSGAFWDGIAAMGGPRLTPGQTIEALEEAIAIIRDLWDADRRGGVRFDGEYYQINGAKRGPAPLHDIGIWIGAYKPRILGLTGRVGDGWIPSLAYLSGGPSDLEEMNKHIDDGAAKADRSPTAIRRMLNISGTFRAENGGLLSGPPKQWAEELAELTFNYGTSGFILASDDAYTTEMFAQEVAPATREIVNTERARTGVSG